VRLNWDFRFDSSIPTRSTGRVNNSVMFRCRLSFAGRRIAYFTSRSSSLYFMMACDRMNSGDDGSAAILMTRGIYMLTDLPHPALRTLAATVSRALSESDMSRGKRNGCRPWTPPLKVEWPPTVERKGSKSSGPISSGQLEPSVSPEAFCQDAWTGCAETVLTSVFLNSRPDRVHLTLFRANSSPFPLVQTDNSVP
jgi:hypothetical protein